MNYTKTLEYLYAQLPMYHRIGKPAYKADLKDTVAICSALGNPHLKFKTIHVAGTNGKGSVCHMLASILQTAGYKTGLFTSPHLKDFRERIRINGKCIPRGYVVSFVAKHQSQFTEIKPSFFEWTAGLAFHYFGEEKVDVAVIETGLGGRLDSTNVITPELSVITNISFDHQDILGNTLRKIAFEKAGIIKPGIPVVIGESHPETDDVFIVTAEKNRSEIYFADKNTPAIYYRCGLKGNYQQKNIRTVMMIVKILRQSGYNISEESIQPGLNEVIKTTGLQGRWQVIHKNPKVICDVAHNPAGIAEVVKQVTALKGGKLHIVIGVVKDKDTDGILSLLPGFAEYYFCRASVPRALNAKDLNSRARKFHLSGKSFTTVQGAIDSALRNASPDDIILITGSTFVVADALNEK